MGSRAVGKRHAPFQGQLQPHHLRHGSLPLIREGDKVPWDKSDYKPTEHSALFESQGGVTIEELVKQLEPLDLALINIGGAWVADCRRLLLYQHAWYGHFTWTILQ